MQKTNKQKILIADDERFNLNILVNILKHDYKIVIAKDGKQAIERAISSLPDLILLDVMMPEMNGYDVCKNLKENEATKEIPIIFITAMNKEDDEAKGFDLGAVDYITKPFRPPIVKARVKAQLKQDLVRTVHRPADVVARYGGEEFIAIFPETDISGAMVLAETMRRNIELLKIPHAQSAPLDYVTVSIGVNSVFPSGGFSESALISIISDADKMLYKAKVEGRNQVKCR